MKRFFDRKDTNWKSLIGALHVYVVLKSNSNIVKKTISISESIKYNKSIAIQPEEYLHMTVQRLDLYKDDLSDEKLRVLIENLRNVTNLITPFNVEFEKPAVRNEAIEVISKKNEQWDNLVDMVRNAICESGLSDYLTDPPFGPHYTVAYCVKNTEPNEDKTLKSVLDNFSNYDFEISSIDLVAVNQKPYDGIFEFTSFAHLKFI